MIPGTPDDRLIQLSKNKSSGLSSAEIALLIGVIFTGLTGLTGSVVTIINAVKVNTVAEQQVVTQEQVKAVAKKQVETTGQIEEVHKIVNSRSDVLVDENKALTEKVLGLSEAIIRIEARLKESQAKTEQLKEGFRP